MGDQASAPEMALPRNQRGSIRRGAPLPKSPKARQAGLAVVLASALTSHREMLLAADQTWWPAEERKGGVYSDLSHHFGVRYPKEDDRGLGRLR
ncbi:MAG: hypothetical protein HY736_07655 [Verrucomicrobia bacterium]|nr:hypothetical protein [Verrucomicrobiota bacterium]